MESLVQLVVALILVVVLAIPFAFVYRHRAEIKRWINDTNYPAMWETDPVKEAERQVMKAEWKLEDARDYLVFKREKEAKKAELEDYPKTETGD